MVLNTSIDDGVDILSLLLIIALNVYLSNAAREYTIDLDSKYILLIDFQIFGDLSVKYGLSDSAHLRRCY